MAYLNLIRWKTLLILGLIPFLIKYTLFSPFGVPFTLNWFGISLLSFSIMCLATSGFIIKAIYNVKADKINNPEKLIIGKNVPVKQANKLFFIFTIVGVLIGFYIANIIGYPSFSIIYILTSSLLYANATSLKKYALIGPLILSLLVGLVILSVGLFDLFPAINDENQVTGRTYFSILTDYYILIALLNFLNELILNQKNIDGDNKLGRNSLSLILGKKRTNYVIFTVCLLPIAGVTYYTLTYLYQHFLFPVYAIVFILAPLVYVLLKLISAEKKKDYALLSKVLKFVMLFSVLSIALYQFILI